MIKRFLILQTSSVVIGVVAVLSYVTVANLVHSYEWVDHTNTVIQQIHSIKDDVTDCQTSVREYLFSENEVNLVPYLNRSPGLQKEIDELQWLTRDNEKQQKNVYEFRLNVERRIDEWRKNLAISKDVGFAAARERAVRSFGESWIQSTRNLTEIMESEEVRLLSIRTADYKNKASIVMYGIPMLMIVYIFIFNASTRFLLEKMLESGILNARK